MGVTGDFTKLDRLIKKLDAAARGAAMESVKKALADEATSQLAFGFRMSRDPYGTPWRPLKRRQGKPLLDTGRLRGSFSAQLTSTGFRIGSNVVYAAPHQFGSKRGRPPQRRMLPSGARGLGPIWTKAFKSAANDAFRKFLR